MKVLHYTTLICCLLLVAHSLLGQVRFVADANAKTTVLNSYFEVTFILENANGSRFQPPPFKDFQVVSGPARYSQSTTINGQATQKSSYTYTLQPKQVGTFKIGKAAIVVQGKTLQTEPLFVKVVEGKAAKGEKAADVEYFVRAEPSTEQAYVGQQVILDFKLYTVANIDSYNVLSEPEYAGFYAQDIKRYNSSIRQEVVEGVQYATKVLKRVALFPQQAGQLFIEPVELQLGIAVNDPRQQRSFFSVGRVRRVPVRTDSVTIDVAALPDNAPPYFTGAVGQYEVGMSINQNNISTDDVIALRMVVRGNGDTKRISPPIFDLPVDSFEIYEPRVAEENTIERQGELNGQKVFEYLVLPKYAGTFRLQSNFSYFDTDSLKYITLSSTPYPVRVRPGTRKKGTAPIAEQAELIEDIRFIKADAQLQQEKSYFFKSPLFWGLLFTPFLLLGGAVVHRQARDKEEGVDAITRKRLRAQRLAQKRLKTAETHLKQSDSKAFYDEISRALFGYICDKLNIPLAQLSKSNVKGKLQELQVDNSSIAEVMTIIKTCETALFAGMDNSNAMQEIYKKTLDTVTNIEAAFK
ncbi:MAG: BatD family protein [Bacteroidota bacterium]